MSCSTVLPLSTSVVRRARRSSTLPARAALAILAASSWNCSFFATKSVSQFSSTMTPSVVPSSSAVIRPLPAVRAARLPASLTPLRRRISTACSKSPSASARAFLQSIIPAPVCSRSRFTSAAEKFAMSWFLARQSSRLFWSPVAACCRRRSLFVGVGLSLGQRFGGHSPAGAHHVTGDLRRPRRLRWGGVGGRGGTSPRGGAGARGGADAQGGVALKQVPLPLRQRLFAGELVIGRLLVAVRRAGPRDEALRHRVCDHAGEQRDAADRIVVTRDRVVHLVRVAVRVQDGDDRDAELARLADRDVLLLGVHHPDRARDPRHVPDTAEGPLQLVALALEVQQLLLGHAGAGHVVEVDLLEFLQPL